jgi:aminopeptidase C
MTRKRKSDFGRCVESYLEMAMWNPPEKFWSVYNRRDRDWKGFSKVKDPAPQICFEEWEENGVKHFKVYELICEFTEEAAE